MADKDAVVGIRIKTNDAIQNMALNSESVKYAQLLTFYVECGLVNWDGSPKNKRLPECLQASEELEGMLVLGMSERMPTVSEGTQLLMATESDTVKQGIRRK